MLERKKEIEQLFNDIRNGDQKAFDQLFARYYNKLFSFARLYLKNVEMAAEVTSELFVKIWIRRDDLSQVLRPEVYLFVSIKNACLNQIRAEKRKPILWTAKVESSDLEQVGAADYDFLEQKEFIRILDLAVAKLPEQRKIIFKLIKEDGLKTKAVARILDLSVRTVENQLYKAVKSLAASLTAYLGYHPGRKNIKPPTISDLAILFF